MKYIITESQYNKAIDKFITYQFEPHEKKTSKYVPNYFFWIKDGEVIVEIQNSKYFWVKLDIWVNISNMLSLEDYETKQVIKKWLEKHYELGGLTPVANVEE